MRAENVLILFPTRKVGASIMQTLGPEYRLLFVVASRGDEEYFTHKKRGNADVVCITGSIQSFWQEQGDRVKDFLSRLPGVLYFMGTDWLSLRIEHREEDWAIDHARLENKKFALVEKILAGLDEEQQAVWINIAYGRHTPDAEGKIFCNTRYGLTGFLKSVELEPRHKNLKVVNVCLNYFRRQKDQSKPLHCEHCVSEDLAVDALAQANGDDFVSLVIRSIKRI